MAQNRRTDLGASNFSLMKNPDYGQKNAHFFVELRHVRFLENMGLSNVHIVNLVMALEFKVCW